MSAETSAKLILEPDKTVIAPEEPRELTPEEQARQKFNNKLPMTTAEFDLLTKSPDGTKIKHHRGEYEVKHGTYYRVKKKD
jgi:hypothetical protein